MADYPKCGQPKLHHALHPLTFRIVGRLVGDSSGAREAEVNVSTVLARDRVNFGSTTLTFQARFARAELQTATNGQERASNAAVTN